MGFASAIDLGYDMAQSNLVASIAKDVVRFHDALQLNPVKAVEAAAL